MELLLGTSQRLAPIAKTVSKDYLPLPQTDCHELLLCASGIICIDMILG